MNTFRLGKKADMYGRNYTTQIEETMCVDYKGIPVKTLKNQGMSGAINCHSTSTSNKRKTSEYISTNLRTRSIAGLWGKREKRIFDPSSGGIGTRLKMASERLTKTM